MIWHHTIQYNLTSMIQASYNMMINSSKHTEKQSSIPWPTIEGRKGFVHHWYISESTLMPPRDSNQFVALWSLSFVKAAVQITLIVLVAGLVTVAGGVAVGWMSKFLIPSIVNLARCLAVSPIDSRINPRKATSRTHGEWGTNFRSQNIFVNLSKIFWSQREIWSCRYAKFIR